MIRVWRSLQTRLNQGANGIIVVDLASGESWRKLNDHPSTKAEPPSSCLPIVEGQPLMERQPDDTTKPMKMGADGIAISADGSRLYYCPLISRRLYSVAIDALVDRLLDDQSVAATVIDEGDKGGGADGLESEPGISTLPAMSIKPFSAALKGNGKR